MGATEYLILLILAALTTMALYEKYGRAVGGNVGGAGKKVETLGQDDNGHIVEQSASSDAVTSSGAGAGSAGGLSTSPEALPQPITKTRGAASQAVDIRIVILLGIAAMAVAALMVLSIAQRIRKQQKREKARRSG